MDQFMVGEDLLVAPVWKQGRLPEVCVCLRGSGGVLALVRLRVMC